MVPANRRVLQGAGDHYIIGEKMRLGRRGQPAEALSRSGRYRELKEGLEIKEVVIGGDSVARRRYVLVCNPEEAKRDRKKRGDIVAEVQRRLTELQVAAEPHNKAACALRAHPTYGRYVKQSKADRLSLDRGRIRAEASFDGKFLVSSSDDELTAEEIALGYKQLWRIERVHRDLKHVVDVRPVFHRLEDRIRAHVLLCWLAQLLIRVVENETGETWAKLKPILAKMKVGIHLLQAGEVWKSSTLTPVQKDIFRKLKAKTPPDYLAMKTGKREAV